VALFRRRIDVFFQNAAIGDWNDRTVGESDFATRQSQPSKLPVRTNLGQRQPLPERPARSTSMQTSCIRHPDTDAL